MVKQRRQGGDGWTFVFLGANQDSYATGNGLSISRGATLNYKADGAGVHAAMADLSKGVTRARTMARSGVASNAAERASFFVSRTAEADLARRGGTAHAQAVPGEGRGGVHTGGHAGHAGDATRKLGHRSRRRRAWVPQVEDEPFRSTSRGAREV
mmetsp:Transcript_58457/g.173725  ORF Transcript_58457/g.173725 Transcript_58457/m.173725 type:complete len:155 (+) Transcript_58457:829-1293(+)